MSTPPSAPTDAPDAESHTGEPAGILTRLRTLVDKNATAEHTAFHDLRRDDGGRCPRRIFALDASVEGLPCWW